MTSDASYPKAYKKWKESWARSLSAQGLVATPIVWDITESAWNTAVRFMENAVRIDEDGCLQCPDCQQEIKVVVRCEITDIPVVWDRKQEGFDYSTLDGEITDNDISSWYCASCGWQATDPPMIDMTTLEEL